MSEFPKLPGAWREAIESILSSSEGVFLLLGGPDTGKTTFLLTVEREASQVAGQARIGLVDSDAGQSTIGPPTSIGLRVVPQEPGETDLLYFVGDTSPRGHLMETVVGTRLMVERALALGCRRVVVDSCGMISHPLGEVLKYFKVELLRPKRVVAFERKRELERTLSTLAGRDVAVSRLSVSPEVPTVSREARAALRAERYRRYFAGAGRVRLPRTIPTYPAAVFWSGFEWENLLVGLQDAAWTTAAIGTIVSLEDDFIEVVAPLPAGVEVAGLVLGYLRVTPEGQELGRVKPWELALPATGSAHLETRP